jgi:hypothetical protein
MPKIQIWKILDDGDLEEAFISSKRPGEPKPFKPDVREHETIERMRRVCSSPSDVALFIKGEWKLFFNRGLRLLPDEQKWGSNKTPKMVDLVYRVTWFGEYPCSKIAPLGKPTNWLGLNKDHPPTYLAYSLFMEMIFDAPLPVPPRIMFQNTGVNVEGSSTKVRLPYNRDQNVNQTVVSMDLVLFLDDWVEIGKAATVSRLTGDDPMINRHYAKRDN